MNEFTPGHEGLLKSLNAIQTELRVPKNQVNKYGNYNFRNCDDIVEAVKPMLKKYNIVLLMYDTIECINNHTYVKATASLVAVTGEKIEVTALAREVEEKTGILTEPMLTGSASSYARKYALNGLFALDDSKDPDDNIDPRKTVDNPKDNPKSAVPGPSPKQIEIINNWIESSRSYWTLPQRYGVKEAKDLTKEQASELIDNIYRGNV